MVRPKLKWSVFILSDTKIVDEIKLLKFFVCALVSVRKIIVRCRFFKVMRKEGKKWKESITERALATHAKKN